MKIRELFEGAEGYIGAEVVLEGWIRNHRKQKNHIADRLDTQLQEGNY